MVKKRIVDCSDCRHQMSGFDGGFGGLPFTCECRIFGETENRESCRRFEKRMSRSDLFERIRLLEKENEQLKEENIRLKNLRKYCAEWIGVKEDHLYDVVRYE